MRCSCERRERDQAGVLSLITGEASAPAGSVLDHAFGRGATYTLGVEEEYQRLDGETFDLVQHIETMLEAVTGHDLEAPGGRAPVSASPVAR